MTIFATSPVKNSATRKESFVKSKSSNQIDDPKDIDSGEQQPPAIKSSLKRKMSMNIIKNS